MIRSSRIHEVEGIEQGEHLMLLALNDDEFILTVVEPEDYGDSRQSASMALTREQMTKLISSSLIALYETEDQTGD